MPMTHKRTPRAIRPVFVPQSAPRRVQAVDVEFDWFPGFAIQQQQLSIYSFHDAIRCLDIATMPLEISTRSPDELGRCLSAFNLRVVHPIVGNIPLESAFQSSKVFADGGPYLDLAQEDSKAAKRDPRIRNPTSR